MIEALTVKSILQEFDQKKVMIIQKELLTLTERPIATNWKATDSTMHGILGRTDLSGGLSSSHYDPWQIMIDENMKVDGAKKQEENQKMFWQYRTGKKGGGSWAFMDEETTKLLEDAFLKDCVELILQTENGWGYRYNFREMTQTSMPPTEDHAPMTRPVRRVHDVHEV